ncbi:MAG: acetyl-coenzyme A synthetase, partial [Roseovarius sp.]|nr:acetyl-coenzyme A synthetase [Roseovarius sp.]
SVVNKRYTYHFFEGHAGPFETRWCFSTGNRRLDVDQMNAAAGHLIGPFEVESALMEHAAVAEVAVIGLPDETAGERVKAFVALKPGFAPADELLLDLIGHARKRLGPAVAPKEIVFRRNLPKTRSGKIMRRLLRARELGLPEGDISTLESDEQ